MKRLNTWKILAELICTVLSCHKQTSYICIIKNQENEQMIIPNYARHSLLLSFCCAITLLSSGCKEKDMSLKMNEPRNIKGVISYKRSFGDLNDKHLEAAHALGIRPIVSRQEAEQMTDGLVHIVTNERYVVDSLTHSLPYLVPRAGALLDSIGLNFLDSLTSKGLNPHHVVVTSVLRTKDDVKRLRRRNGNASENSAHFFGTTFDVSWKRFAKVEDPDGRPLQSVGADTLKLVLSEVLADMSKANKCYIKYELKQGCFHVTTR